MGVLKRTLSRVARRERRGKPVTPLKPPVFMRLTKALQQRWHRKVDESCREALNFIDRYRDGLAHAGMKYKFVQGGWSRDYSYGDQIMHYAPDRIVFSGKFGSSNFYRAIAPNPVAEKAWKDLTKLVKKGKLDSAQTPAAVEGNLRTLKQIEEKIMVLQAINKRQLTSSGPVL